MTLEPSIYVSFYHRYVHSGTRCARIGSGALTDVIKSVEGPSLCVLSSLRFPPSEPVAVLGRAGFDPLTGGIEQRELPPLDANGAPLWLFWEGSQLSLQGAVTLLGQSKDWGEGSSVFWVELRGAAGHVLRSETQARLALEAAWTQTWPDGPVLVRFAGTSEELFQWTGAEGGQTILKPDQRNGSAYQSRSSRP